MKGSTTLFIALLGVALGCASKSGDTAAPSTATTTQSAAPGGEQTSAKGYAVVQQVFNENCIMCHGNKGRPRGGINLSSYASVMKGGEDGPIVKPGDPAKSVLSQALHGAHGVRQMPPRRALPKNQINTVDTWIKNGAKNS